MRSACGDGQPERGVVTVISRGRPEPIEPMEILIVGVIIVGLMVYASTRVKRSAAQAFEPETIEMADFTLEKPAGFLYVLNGDPALSFEAYSKDMGADDAARFRAGRAELRIYNDRKLQDSAAALKGSANIENEVSEVIDNRKYVILEGRSEEDGIVFRETFKLVENEGRVYEFRIKVLELADTHVHSAADAMLASFVLK